MASQPAHDERRRRIAELSCRVIATRGLSGLTIRTVAAEVGFSTAVVTHYFHNKRDQQLHTYEYAASRTIGRRGDSVEQLADLWTILSRILPIDDIAKENWRVFVAYWGAASGDEELVLQHRSHVRSARALIASRLPAEIEAPEEVARRLLVTVMGISTQAIFDPDQWPPERQLAVLAQSFADAGLGKTIRPVE